MKNFTVDEELEKILLNIGKTFEHKDIYETIFNGFLFLRFLEEIHKNENKLFLQYTDGRTIELPVSELLKKNIEKEEELPKPSEAKKRTNKKKSEKKTKIIR
jgi:hypothetical protein